MRTICSMAAGFGLAVSVFAAPIASALPGEGPVAVNARCMRTTISAHLGLVRVACREWASG